jgi:hypothetical protein
MQVHKDAAAAAGLTEQHQRLIAAGAGPAIAQIEV